MPGCAVKGCNNYNRATKGTKIRYYRFPKDKTMLQKWILACRRDDTINLKNACICSNHFEPNCFVGPSLQQHLLQERPRNKRNLIPDAVPTLKLPPCKLKSYGNREDRAAELEERVQFQSTPADYHVTLQSDEMDISGLETENECEKNVNESTGEETSLDVKFSYLENDMQNFLSWKTKPSVPIQMKPTAVPYMFDCQNVDEHIEPIHKWSGQKLRVTDIDIPSSSRDTESTDIYCRSVGVSCNLKPEMRSVSTQYDPPSFVVSSETPVEVKVEEADSHFDETSLYMDELNLKQGVEEFKTEELQD